jgi:hypothetical protein
MFLANWCEFMANILSSCSYTPNGYGFSGTTGGGGLGYDLGGDFAVDSTTSSGTGFEPRSNSTELPDSQNMSLMSPSGLPSASIPADSVQISELLARTITDAHTRTCLYSNGESRKHLNEACGRSYTATADFRFRWKLMPERKERMMLLIQGSYVDLDVNLFLCIS